MEKNNPSDRKQAGRGKKENLGFGIYQKEVGNLEIQGPSREIYNM